MEPEPYYTGAYYLALTSRGWRWLYDKHYCVDRARQNKQPVIYVLKKRKLHF